MKSYLGTVIAGDSSQRGKHFRYLTPRGILSWEAWASDTTNRLLTKSLLQLVRRVTMECHPGNLLVNCRQRWVANENCHRVHAHIQPCRQCRPPWTIRWFFVSKYASSQSSGVVIRMSRLPPYRVLCTKMSVNVVNDVHTGKVPGYLSRERFQTVQVVFVSKDCYRWGGIPVEWYRSEFLRNENVIPRSLLHWVHWSGGVTPYQSYSFPIEVGIVEPW